ncbi:MAG TPA: sulfite exporter TauE/SafE family protein [bacterium]|nr:sulfite exporter TauE/SafE family protein [bacterium]
MIAISLVVGLSAAAAAATGFGFNLVSAPLLTFVYPPRLVVVLTLLLGVCASGLLALRPEIRREVEWTVIRPLFLSSLAGMPIGVALLLWGRPQVLRAAIAALTAAFAIVMLTRFRPRLRGTLLDTIAVGVLSGLLSTSTSLNGPPVALYLVARGLPRDRFRATMVVYVFLATATSLVLLALGGTISASTIALATKLLPALLLGFVVGVALVGRLSDRAFETMVLGFLVLVGVLGVGAALR